MVAIQTGKVVGGVIVVDNADDLVEGETVTVVSHTGDEPFELTPEQEELLAASIAQANRGELITSEQLKARLRRR
jgi:hypothetical protein